jgi:conjugal transfer mating pair stabilization protein TraG
MVQVNILGHLQVFQQGMVALQMIFHPTTGSTDWSNGAAWMGVGPVGLLALTFALLHISTKGIWMQKFELHHVGLMLGMYAALFVPTVQVDIHDMMTGQDAIVDDIPIGIAYPAAGISALAVDAANQIGTAFQSPTANAPPLPLSNGFASPLKQMIGLRHFYYQVAQQDPTLTVGLSNFIQQCVYPLADTISAFRIESLSQDPNLINTLLTTSLPSSNAGIIQMQVVSTGGASACTQGNIGDPCTESCNQAQTDLQAAYTAWQTGTGSTSPGAGSCAVAVQSATTLGDTAVINDCDTGANSSLASVAGSANSGGAYGQSLANVGTFGSKFLQQLYGACLVSGGWQKGMNGTTGQNNPVVMPSYCQIQGTSQNSYNVENAASANMFISNMPAMMSILQFLFFALAPLSAAVMLFAGGQGIGIFTKYLMFGLWTQSWFPVAAVLNDYGQMTASEMLSKLGVSLSAGGTPDVNSLITMAHLPDTLMQVQQILGNVDMMLALTPVITMIVFTGSYMAMSNLAQDINGEVQTGKNVGLEAPSLSGVGGQTANFGVRAAGTAGGGMIQSSSASSMESVNLGDTLSAMRGATIQKIGNNSASYGTGVGEIASLASQVTDASGRTVAAQVMNSTSGRLVQGTKVGQAFQGAIGSGISSNAVEVASLAYQAAAGEMLSSLAGDKSMNWEQKVERAAKAGVQAVKDLASKVGIGSALGAGLHQMANGLSGKIGTDVQNALKDTQDWKSMRDAAQSTTRELTQAAQNSFSRTNDQRHQDALTKAVNDSKSAQTANSTSVSELASEQEAQSRTQSLGGSRTLTAPALQASLDAMGFSQKGNMSTANYLQAEGVKLFGGDAAAFQSKVDSFLPVEGNYQAAAARAILAGVGGAYGEAVSNMSRVGVANDLMKTLEGGQANAGNVDAFRELAHEQIGSDQQAVHSGKQSLDPAKTRADSAGKVAAQSRDQGNAAAQPKPPSDVNPNATPESLGGQGAQNDLYAQGMAAAAAQGGQGKTTDTVPQVTENIGVGSGNLKSWVMDGAKLANKYLPQTVGGMALLNFASGVANQFANNVMAKKAAEKLLNKGSGGAPTADGASDAPGKGGGGGSGGDPAAKAGGTPAERPALSAERTVEILDKDGKVIGTTTQKAIGEEAAAVARESGVPIRQAVASIMENMGARAVAVGGAAFSVAEFATGPVGMGIQAAFETKTLGAAELPSVERRKQAVEALLSSDQKFAAAAAYLKENENKPATAQTRSAYAYIQKRLEEKLGDS